MLAILSAIVATCCGGGDKVDATPTGSAKLSVGSSVSWDATSQFLQITAPGGLEWTARIDGGTWCSFSSGQTSISGKGDASHAIYYEANNTNQSRTATVTVSFAGSNVATLSIVQAAYAAPGASTATLSKNNVGWNDAEKVVTIEIVSTVGWTLSVEDEWMWFDYEDYATSTSGKGNASVSLYYASNGTAQSRTGYITVAFTGQTPFKLSLTQSAQGADTPADTPSYEDKSWAELPSISADDGFLYVTHSASLNNKSVRNYTMCYDKEYKVARWVAYPLHSCYTKKTVDRTDAWSYDPLIPVAYQVNMAKGMNNGYDRGHQIPSADRVASRELNAQTFYYTNMTAQVGRGLNQSVWGNLENKIRNDYMCSDTLYVVTGCVVATAEDPTVQWADNSNGGKVVVPKAYFKILLRTKSGNSGKVVDSSNATTIGFWYENRSYSHSQPQASDVMSVKEIEDLTGFTFFPQISDEVKSTVDTGRWGL